MHGERRVILLAALASIVLVGLSILIHYEFLGGLWRRLPTMTVRPRARLIVVVFVCFIAHTIEIWLYAVGYYLFAEVFNLGSFGGESPLHDFIGYVYYSAVTYTSLGLGDIFPLRGLRLISGVEALNGLLLIGWSASFTYLAMEKFWPLHWKRRLGDHEE